MESHSILVGIGAGGLSHWVCSPSPRIPLKCRVPPKLRNLPRVQILCVSDFTQSQQLEDQCCPGPRVSAVREQLQRLRSVPSRLGPSRHTAGKHEGLQASLRSVCSGSGTTPPPPAAEPASLALLGPNFSKGPQGAQHLQNQEMAHRP